MEFTRKSREDTIEKWLKIRKELYVVDIKIVDNKTNETADQWVIYEDLENAQNYLAIVENFQIMMDEDGSYKLKELANDNGNGDWLRFRYIDNAGNDISETFTITKIERAA